MRRVLDHAIAEQRRLRQLPPPKVRRLIREVAGVSQDAVGAEVGVNRASISRYESGDRTPRGAVLDAYSAVLRRLAAESARGTPRADTVDGEVLLG